MNTTNHLNVMYDDIIWGNNNVGDIGPIYGLIGHVTIYPY